MWITRASGRRAATAAASVVLPEPAGPSTQTSRPSPRVGGRASRSDTTTDAASCGPRTGSEGQAMAAVRRDRLDEPVPVEQLDGVRVLERLAGLRVPEPHQVADPERRGRVPGQGGLHLAR